MGACSAKIPLPDDLVLEISSNLNDASKKLLELNLHYDHYDRQAQLKIDQLTAASLGVASAPKSQSS
jgi:hypothetical protein